MRAQPAATPMAFVRAIVLAYEKYGVDPSRALRATQITRAQLDREDARITALQMEKLAELAMQELDDETLGWFSRRLPWGTYGMLSRASLTAPNLGVALKRWCRHQALLTKELVLSLVVESGEARIEIEEHRRFGEMRELCLVTMLRFVHGYACWAIDSRIPLRRVTFPFASPPHRDAYPRMFPGPVSFDAPRAGFAFDAEYLGLSLRRDEHAMRTMLQRALQLTVVPYRRDRLLVHQVRELLERKPANTATALSRALHISIRTLHRQLSEEDSSLQRLKDDVRRRQAIELLARTSRPIKQIASTVGFGSEKSFIRAFRGWTGRSPGDFRRDAFAAKRSR
ncbi:MAG: AraC family transcriptional regulator [Polyangiales bacterium]